MIISIGFHNMLVAGEEDGKIIGIREISGNTWERKRDPGGGQ